VEGGRLILCHYRNPEESRVDVARVAEQAGYAVAGRTEVAGVTIAWIDRVN
jgi:hypothetical protein